jgi:serine/threonine-protein kinase 19
MNNKRKLATENEITESDTSNKKLKSTETRNKILTPDEKLKEDHRTFITLLTMSSEELESEHEDLLKFSMDYFLNKFPENKFEHLPNIILLNQIYCLIKNKTEVDRSLEEMRLSGQIIMFKSDDDSSYMINSGTNNDIYICYFEEFRDYINAHVKSYAKEEEKWLVDVYLEKILANESNDLSIEKATLMNKYKLSEKDLTGLINLGLFTIKDVGNFWFAIPDIGKFRRVLLECRRSFMNLIRKQKYTEININLFFDKLIVSKNKNFKHVRNIGAIYLISDMLGKETVRKVISPMGVVVKLNN